MTPDGSASSWRSSVALIVAHRRLALADAGPRVHRRRAGRRARHAGGRADRRHRAARAGRRQPGRSSGHGARRDRPARLSRLRSSGARAELADAEAGRRGQRQRADYVDDTTTSGVSTARGGVEQAQAAVARGRTGLDAAKARLRHARRRGCAKQAATATGAARDVERLKAAARQGRDLAAAVRRGGRGRGVGARRASTRRARRCTRPSWPSSVAESRLAQAASARSRRPPALRDRADGARAGGGHASARAASAEARVKQARGRGRQAELNLEHTTVKAPIKGIVSRKTASRPGRSFSPASR